MRQYEEGLDDSERISLQSEGFKNKLGTTEKIDINNNKMLKNLNLYESGEHMKFQKEFNQGINPSQTQSVNQTQKNQTSQRMDYYNTGRQEANPSQRSEYLNFGPSQRSGNYGNTTGPNPSQRSNNSNNGFKFIKPGNNQGQIHQSFGNNQNQSVDNNLLNSNPTEVEDSTRQNNELNQHSFKLHKINQKEIENLKKMTNQLREVKERMKTIASNNSVSENTDNNDSMV